MVIEAAGESGIMVVPEGGAKFEHNLTEIVDGHTGIEHAIPLATAYDDVKQLWSKTGTGYTPTFVVAYGGLSGERYWYDRTEVWKNERLMRWSPRSVIEPASIRRQPPDEPGESFLERRTRLPAELSFDSRRIGDPDTGIPGAVRHRAPLRD